jgi:predicted Rossmann-fold nucleotide-binding protein
MDEDVSECIKQTSKPNDDTDTDYATINTIQRIMTEDIDDSSPQSNHYIKARLESQVAHRETLIHNVIALVFLPRDISTFDVLFALICEIQTRRKDRIPVFLVSVSFWKPIADEPREGLSGQYDGQFIKCSDLDIVRVVDSTPSDEEVGVVLEAICVEETRRSGGWWT